jgi:hypothetical protein
MSGNTLSAWWVISSVASDCRPPVLWQAETLMALQSSINLLDNPALRQAAKGFLLHESAQLKLSAPDISAVLDFIARRVDVSQAPPTELILHKLGADYFKYAALQVEPVSSDMALWLMLIAQQLRPQAEFINERFEHYRQKSSPTPGPATG